MRRKNNEIITNLMLVLSKWNKVEIISKRYSLTTTIFHYVEKMEFVTMSYLIISFGHLFFLEDLSLIVSSNDFTINQEYVHSFDILPQCYE